MTVHRLPRRLVILAFLALALVGILASACRSIASPEGWASPVLADGLLLVAHRDELFALDPESLSRQWAFPSDEDDVDVVALYGTSAALDSTVFLPTYDGILYALDAESGGPLWQPFETDGPLIGGVAVSQETVYFGSSDGKVYALDAASGERRWAPFETGGEVWSTPALAGDALYLTSLDGRVYALDAASGSERWSFSTNAGIASPPVVDQEAGLVYVGGFDSHLRAVDLETHEERWAVKADNWFWTRPLVAGGVVYAGGLDGNVYAVDALTGESRWPEPFSTEAPVRSAPVIAGDALIIIDRDGNVYGIDPSDGSALANSPLVLAGDVLADPLVMMAADSQGNEGSEQVVVVTTDGEVVRIDPTTLQEIDSRKLTGD